MRQNDGTGARIFENTITNNVWSWPSPVQWIDIPKHDFVTELLIDPFFLTGRDRSIRGAQQSGPVAACAPNCVFGFLQLAANSFVRHLGEIRMRPTVIRNFMSFAYLSRHDFGILGNVLADQEKGCLDVMAREQLE